MCLSIFRYRIHPPTVTNNKVIHKIIKLYKILANIISNMRRSNRIIFKCYFGLSPYVEA